MQENHPSDERCATCSIELHDACFVNSHSVKSAYCSKRCARAQGAVDAENSVKKLTVSSLNEIRVKSRQMHDRLVASMIASHALDGNDSAAVTLVATAAVAASTSNGGSAQSGDNGNRRGSESDASEQQQQGAVGGGRPDNQEHERDFRVRQAIERMFANPNEAYAYTQRKRKAQELVESLSAEAKTTYETSIEATNVFKKPRMVEEYATAGAGIQRMAEVIGKERASVAFGLSEDVVKQCISANALKSALGDAWTRMSPWAVMSSELRRVMRARRAVEYFAAHKAATVRAFNATESTRRQLERHADDDGGEEENENDNEA